VIALARQGEILANFSGSVEGVIIPQEKGTGGFGYDSLFVPDGHCETFAQLGSEIKNSLSHRARALSELKNWPNWGTSPI
jgi:XTP/dITP diphosphohydrolase